MAITLNPMMLQKNAPSFTPAIKQNAYPGLQKEDDPYQQFTKLLGVADQFKPKMKQSQLNVPQMPDFNRTLDSYNSMLQNTIIQRSKPEQGMAPNMDMGGMSNENIPNSNIDRGSIVGFARSMLGKPYIWGSTDATKGVDCSGLTWNAARTQGLKLPRTASQQSAWFKQNGRSMNDISKAKPGDMLYFRSSGPSGWHTGVYIGGGKMIHAAGKKTGVVTSNVSENYLKRLVNIGVV